MDRQEALKQLERLSDIRPGDDTLVSVLLGVTQAEQQIIIRQRKPLCLLGACVRSALACAWKNGLKGIGETADMLREVKSGKKKALWQYVCQYDAALKLTGQLEENNKKLKEQIGSTYCEKVLCALQQLVEAHRRTGGKVILFFAPFFYGSRLQDGYFQRVQAVDQMLPDEYLRIYVSWFEADPTFGIMQCKVIDDRHIELTRPYPHPVYDEATLCLAQMVGLVYHHSITFALEKVTRCQSITKIIDVHGAYPEEERLYGKYQQADLDETQERLAMVYGQYAICVTEQMRLHLKEKYPQMQAKPLLLPIFTNRESDAGQAKKLDVSGKPRCVYAGGMQAWQCVEEMQKLIRHAGDQYDFCIFTRQPEVFWRQWKGARPKTGLTVESRTPEELRNEYSMCQYGLMLREDCVINRVACPTKLIEYLEYGIIPVLSTTAIGDFMQDGLRYITAEDMAAGRVPTANERKEMVSQNMRVLQKMKKREQTGKTQLLHLIEAEAK